MERDRGKERETIEDCDWQGMEKDEEDETERKRIWKEWNRKARQRNRQTKRNRLAKR